MTYTPEEKLIDDGSITMSDAEQASFDRRLAFLVLVAGAIAFVSSCMLVFERLQIYIDASHVSSCDVNALLNCGTVMRTPYAEAFGFPNPFIGLVGYAIVLTISTAILAGARFSRWYWLAMNIGHLLATVFVFWLWYNTTFKINALCLFCMFVWVTQIIMMGKITARNIIAGIIPAPFHLRETVAGWSWFAIVLVFVLIFGIIFIRFSDIILGMF
ncbi:vitamin K epoxide reductase family protein [Rothia sp. CCM 9419]|uniref:vitamin K epoxide reductase family protein n=1 Tax=Rothia sp. CCM 9419 TaxID=3402662 RepID=UPI003AE65893